MTHPVVLVSLLGENLAAEVDRLSLAMRMALEGTCAFWEFALTVDWSLDRSI